MLWPMGKRFEFSGWCHFLLDKLPITAYCKNMQEFNERISMITTRFAPSPTGFMHIGSARTALLAFVYAKSNNGNFILRIEDTDQDRSKQEFTDSIIEDLEWMGIDYDSISYQSKNYDKHGIICEDFISRGLAYKKDGAVFLKIPESKDVVINDSVKGNVKFNTDNYDDFVIMRSSGVPSFLFANAVDDYSSGVSHIIRGDDHMTNTLRQSFIYEYLDYSPEFIHMPLVLGKDKKKLSKRNGSYSISDIRKMGIPSQALLSILMKLGVYISDEDVFDINEIVRLFRNNSINNRI